jgi:hypothetical protein
MEAHALRVSIPKAPLKADYRNKAPDRRYQSERISAPNGANKFAAQLR